MQYIEKIIKEITDASQIKSVYFVGCGASRSDLFPAFYFLNNNAKTVRASIHTAKEFICATPVGVDESAIVLACSLGGNTPETVQAVSHAKAAGAHVIALTHYADSEMTADADYTVVFTWEESYSSKMDKMIKALKIAAEILNNVEGYAHYEALNHGFEISYGLIDEEVKTAMGDARRFAQAYKDVPILYVTSSGAMQEIAWSFSSCLMMEMQWIPASSFHDGDFFHGPFEMVENDVPYLLFINEGSTRAMDLRTLEFLQRFQTKVTYVDAKDLGIGNYFAKEVIDYFNPIMVSPIIRMYAEQLAIVREHPLTKRRYMWKLNY